MRLPVNHPSAGLALALGCAATLSACGDSRPMSYSAALPANGPQADYPVVVGGAYTVAGTAYTPEDVLNYDEVGFATLEVGGGAAITGAHHTLPLPSYVEVTSLDTGRTILLRVERRGPMEGNQLVALSPGAMAQLEAAPGTPVRVRRVNPPEEHRAILRAGEAAPLRMDTPMSLVSVLRRKLPEPVPQIVPQEVAEAPVRLELQLANANPVQEAPFEAAPNTASEEHTAAFVDSFASAEANVQPAAADGGFVVQAAAFSTEERARNAADALAASVSPSGKFYRVRTGPFATRDQAEASLAKVRAAGYKDARIYTRG